MKKLKKVKQVSHLANLSIFALSSGIGGSIVGDNVGIGDLTVSAAWEDNDKDNDNGQEDNDKDANCSDWVV